MPAEIYRLAWNVVLTAAMVIPCAVYRTIRLGGLWQVFLRPLPGDIPFADVWAHRACRAHMNAFEGSALFAPVAVAVHVTGSGNESTAAAAATCFRARLVHAPLYYFEVPVPKALAWFVGLGAMLYLAFELLR